MSFAMQVASALFAFLFMLQLQQVVAQQRSHTIFAGRVLDVETGDMRNNVLMLFSGIMAIASSDVTTFYFL